jgi:DNA polymerase-4
MDENQPLTHRSWPRAILHLDADAFFASCEQALHPELRGRPVVTGKERGIVAAASYEAKARGVERGVRLFEVKRVCPECIIMPSDYETYSLFSARMFAILRRFSPDVEEYSIDEAFVDLTGLRRSFHGPYEMIARQMQETIERELGIPVSVGVSLSKVLAKIASKAGKPHGLRMVPGRDIHLYLRDLPPEKVWGIGPNTAAYLRKLGVRTALQFARKDERFVRRHLTKPHLEIWQELNGRSVYPVETEPKRSYQSIGKTRTFTPATRDEVFIYAQLAKNLENACIKARRHHLAGDRLIVYLKKQDFTSDGVEMRLSRPTAFPSELFGPLRQGFRRIFESGALYRQTGVVLGGLVPETGVQYVLFEDPARVERMARLYGSVDELSARYGKHTVQHAASLPSKLEARHKGERGDLPERVGELFKGENKRQRLGIPMLRMKV